MLDPAMQDRGFGEGGPGVGADGSVSMLYCAGAQELATRWPRAAALVYRRADVDPTQPGACIDLVVEGSPSGELVRLDLEFVELDHLLRLAGHEDLAHACSLTELGRVSTEVAVRRIRAAIETLLPLSSG
jgi:hypothetical protein